MHSPVKSGEQAAVIRALRRGRVGVLKTDTIYGIVGSALKPKTVERIYRLRKRNRTKPFIVLINSVRDLGRFDVRSDRRTSAMLARFWPGPVSIILPCSSKKFMYLHRGTNALAFRVPKPARLRALLEQTGPLVAPSANPEGKPPAATIPEARAYFGNRVDFYPSTRLRAGVGTHTSKPSTLIRIANGVIEILRPGAARIRVRR